MARKPAQKSVLGPESADHPALSQPDPVVETDAGMPPGSTESDPTAGVPTEDVQETAPVDGDAADAHALEALSASAPSMPDSQAAAEAPETVAESVPEAAAVQEVTSARDVSSSTPEVPKEDPAATAPLTTTVVVIGPAKGRWRAGRYFTDRASTLRQDELTDAELKALQADPVLNVLIVTAPY